MVMRLFIAINLNDEIKEHLMTAVGELKRLAVKGTFTHRDNLHLTLVFLGELGSDRVEAVKTAMNQVTGESFLIEVKGFGKFERRGGDIHWAGVGRNDFLQKLQKQLSLELKKEGFSVEDRAYFPHLTLGRQIVLSEPHREVFGALGDIKKEMTVSKISLMKSERINGKLTYTEIYNRALS